MHNERKRAAALVREHAKRRRAWRAGFVTLGEAAWILRTDRRQLARLVQGGIVTGHSVDGTTWLDRRELAAWAFSQPQCIVDGCERRVLRFGPGCSEHPNHGKQHTDETRQLMAQRRREYWGSELTAKTCEWCGEPFEVTPRRAAQRFCDDACQTAWLHNSDGAAARHEAMRDGQGEWQDEREAAKMLRERICFRGRTLRAF